MISIVGTGYVGLVTGACLAQLGQKVTCIDNNKQKLENISKGQLEVYEPGLKKIVLDNIAAGRLKFSRDIASSIPHSDIVIIAVGTPSDLSGNADVSHVYIVAKQIALVMKPNTLIAIKSTVPVGTCKNVSTIVSDTRGQEEHSCAVVSNPEFLREGSAVKDFMNPDRIVIGAEDPVFSERLANLYKTMNLGPILQTNLATSELLKYAANCFLATKLTFINQISDICEATGANINTVVEGLSQDERIGSQYLLVGPGYGGSCLPKDTRSFVACARSFGTHASIIEAVIDINDQRIKRLTNKVIKHLDTVHDPKVAVLGLTFKANTDDVRDSPSLALIKELNAMNIIVHTFDPKGANNALQEIPDLICCKNAEQACKNADAVILMTEWDEFRYLDYNRIKKIMNAPVIFDFRNHLDRNNLISIGFSFNNLGNAK